MHRRKLPCVEGAEGGEMKYYFVDFEGEVISEEEQVKGYYSKDINPEMFISRMAAVKEAKRQLKYKIKELQEQLTEYENELKGDKRMKESK